MTFLAHKHTGCALCSAPLMDKVHFNEIFSKLISHWIDCQRYYERSKLTCDSNPFGIINWFARIFVVKNEENVRAPWHTRNAIFVHSPCPTLRQNVLQLFCYLYFVDRLSFSQLLYLTLQCWSMQIITNVSHRRKWQRLLVYFTVGYHQYRFLCYSKIDSSSWALKTCTRAVPPFVLVQKLTHTHTLITLEW